MYNCKTSILILCDQNPASFEFYDKVPIVLQLRLKSPAQNLQRLLFKQDKSGDMYVPFWKLSRVGVHSMYMVSLRLNA